MPRAHQAKCGRGLPPGTRVFRIRSLIRLFMFGGLGALWGSIALPLTAAPWHLSTTEVGLFGLVGAAGAIGAARAGT